MKLKYILTKLKRIVKSDLFYNVIIMILIATLFYMIGWIACSLTNQEPVSIEDPEIPAEIGDLD